MRAAEGPPPLALPPIGLTSRSLELRQLRYFFCVAHTGNLGRAARELNITQGTVTHQIQKLEEGLGVKLLTRHGRGVTLTAAGMSLFDRLDIIMHLLDAPLCEASRPENTAGTVSVALPAECTSLLGPSLISRCAARWPRLTMNIREADSASIEEWVLAGRVDIGVLQDAPVFEGLDIMPVLTEGLGLVVGVRSPLGDSITSVRLRELIGVPLILPTPRHWIRRRVENAWFRRGISLDLLKQVESLTLIKEMVRYGLGCTVLPHVAVREEVARASLVFRPIEQVPLNGVHSIARRKTVDVVPPTAEIANVMRGIMIEFSKRGVWASKVLDDNTGSEGEGPAAAVGECLLAPSRA